MIGVYFPPILEAGKAESRVSAESVSSEASLLGLQTAAFPTRASLCARLCPDRLF